MKHSKKLAAFLAAGVLTFGLAACGDDSGHSGGHQKQTASNGDVFNEADVEFATGMIPHHAQALSMVDLTVGRDLSPAFQKLADGILAAQGPEIEQMTGWLTDWDKPIPETMRDHVNADHDMDDMDHEDDSDMDSDMPGMMTAEQMADLKEAQGAEFEDMWLEMMIEHHEGAIEMAGHEAKDGTFGPAVDLAESIVTSQRAEIDHMKEMLDS